jgi:hypothetical protein
MAEFHWPALVLLVRWLVSAADRLPDEQQAGQRPQNPEPEHKVQASSASSSERSAKGLDPGGSSLDQAFQLSYESIPGGDEPVSQVIGDEFRISSDGSTTHELPEDVAIALRCGRQRSELLSLLLRIGTGNDRLQRSR